jgi:N-acetylmuramoyl-L-alanine amidase
MLGQQLNFDILKFPSKYFSSRDGSKIRAIIIHSIGTYEISELFNSLEVNGVSAHYVVPQVSGLELQKLMPKEFGKISLQFPNKAPVIELVHPSQNAWHAGASKFAKFNEEPNCEKSLNNCTIGIEFHAPGYAKGDGSDWYKFTPYSSLQQETGIELIRYLMEEYRLPKTHLFAHSTISVGRKTDPGPLFFWNKLYEAGLGYLPPGESSKSIKFSISNILPIQQKLFKIGFIDCPQNGKVDSATQQNIDAFTMQFAPDLWISQNIKLTKELVSRIEAYTR